MNKKIYLYDTENNNIFIGESEAVLDPLEWELNNKINYLIPPDATFKEPIEPKEGFNVCFNKEKDEWEYKEIVIEEIRKDESKNKFTLEQQKVLIEFRDLQDYLYGTDWYITRKIETGKEIPQEIIDKREETRKEISRIREENEDLKQYLC